MQNTDYDLIIIGGGPAGLTAAIYALRARMSVALIEKMSPGGQVLVTDWVENYPGFPEGLSGPDLADKMHDQAKKFGLKTQLGEVHSLDLTDPIKKVTLEDKTLTAYTVIIASGASPRTLHVGEEKFLGKGISYCGTCDGPLYKDKTVVAVGGGDTAVQESLFLTKFAKKVYLVHRREELRATKILRERAFDNDKIKFVWDSVVTGFNGFFGLEGVTVKNVKTNEEKIIAADGCFIWIGILPNTDFVNKAVNVDDSGFIITDQSMQTNIPGVFAVGDVRVTPLRQVATAIGDAAIAAVMAELYVENLTK